MAATHENKHQKHTRKRKLVEFDGYFEPNGAGSPTVVNIPGVVSVTRTAAGALTVLLDDTWVDLTAQATLQIHTDADVVVKVTDCDPVASGGATVKLRTVKSSDGITSVDIANVAGKAGNRIHLKLTCSNGDDFSKNL